MKSKPIIKWSTGTPENSNPPSPLLEALTCPIQRPQPAHLRYTPPYLNSLTRSTLPTSSLSPTLPSSNDPITSPPIRTSVDTLRSLSTSAPSQQSAWSSWFQTEPTSLLSAEDAAPTQPPLHKKYKSTHNPVVFCHGLLGFDTVSIGLSIAPLEVTHWRGIKEVLEGNGTNVLITRVPATSSPADRAKVLQETIDRVYPGQKVHLIGHSMGGLDCRYLTTHLTERKFEVLSITTIATPHRGSYFADHFLQSLLGGPGNLPSLLSFLSLLPNGSGDGKAFEALTLESMKKFNQETPDVEGVKYFSWGAVYEPGLIDTWKYPHNVILEKEGPNDGLVSVASAKWGTYLGTLTHVNHLDLVGWINTARYKWAEMTGKEIKFKPATFYLGIVDMLANEVEGQGHEGEQEVREELRENIEQGERDEEGMSKPTTPEPTKNTV